MKTKSGIILTGLILSLSLLPGCQPSYSTEMSVALTPPPADEAADPNTPAPQPVDPLDVLATVEKIAGKNGLERYTPTTSKPPSWTWPTPTTCGQTAAQPQRIPRIGNTPACRSI